MAPKLFPGEYRRRSLVTVEMDGFEAQVFAPEKLAEQERINPGKALVDSVGVEEHYIVSTHRLDKVWTITVEHDGVVTKIPGKVMERLIAQREAIIREHRVRTGKQSAQARLSKVAQADQRAAALEPGDDFEDLDSNPEWQHLNE